GQRVNPRRRVVDVQDELLRVGVALGGFREPTDLDADPIVQADLVPAVCRLHRLDDRPGFSRPKPGDRTPRQQRQSHTQPLANHGDSPGLWAVTTAAPSSRPPRAPAPWSSGPPPAPSPPRAAAPPRRNRGS